MAKCKHWKNGKCSIHEEASATFFGKSQMTGWKPFCKCEGQHDDKNWCSDPEMVIGALLDAKGEMSYSNYCCGKIDIAISLIEETIKERGIPRRFVGMADPSND